MKGKPFKRFAGILRTVAPTLLTALGGPGAHLAAAVAKKVFGKEEMSDDEFENEVAVATGNAEGLAKLRQIEADLKTLELENDFKFAELEVRDRESARTREVALKDPTPRVLAYVVVGSFCAVVFAVLFGNITAESTLVGAVIGYLSAKADQVASYYFGSSAGSEAKTKIMADTATAAIKTSEAATTTATTAATTAAVAAVKANRDIEGG